MRTREIEFLPGAERALRALFLYISKDDAGAALAMVDRIEEGVMRLAKSPFLGIELPPDEFWAVEPGLRRIVVKPYVVFYRVREEKVTITHIIHGRRNLRTALLEENTTE